MSTLSSRRTDSGLRVWANQAANILTATPVVYGLTLEQAVSFSTKAQNFDTAMVAATNPVLRTVVTIAEKDEARSQLELAARNTIAIIMSDTTVTTAQKAAIGISDRKPPSPRPIPTSSPNIDILSVVGRTVKIRLHGDDTARRGKPTDVMAANIFTYTGGPTPPSIGSEWKFQGTTTRPIVDIDFDPSSQAGTAFITACWFNARGGGPATSPVSVNLPAGNVLPQPMRMSIAA